MHKSTRYLLLSIWTIASAGFVLTACGNGGSSASIRPSSGTSTAASSTEPQQGRCETTDLTISTVDSQVAAGQRYVTLGLKNSSNGPCSLRGFPEMVAYSGQVDVVPNAKHDTSNGATSKVSVQPNQSAYFDMRYSSVSNGNEKCYSISKLLVTPPNDTRQLELPITNIKVDGLCQSTGITVTPIRSTDTNNK